MNSTRGKPRFHTGLAGSEPVYRKSGGPYRGNKSSVMKAATITMAASLIRFCLCRCGAVSDTRDAPYPEDAICLHGRGELPGSGRRASSPPSYIASSSCRRAIILWIPALVKPLEPTGCCCCKRCNRSSSVEVSSRAFSYSARFEIIARSSKPLPCPTAVRCTEGNEPRARWIPQCLAGARIMIMRLPSPRGGRSTFTFSPRSAMIDWKIW